jgi:hypothetical protein
METHSIQKEVIRVDMQRRCHISLPSRNATHMRSHGQAVIALCNIGWELRLCLDTIKESGGQEKIEQILERDDVDEATQHWGNVLVEKLKNSGFQRGCLLDKDIEGRATGFSSRENALGDDNASPKIREIDSPRKEASATCILQHQPSVPTAPGTGGAIGISEGRDTSVSTVMIPGIPDAPLAPPDLDVGMAPSTPTKVFFATSRPPSFNPLTTPHGSVFSTPRGPLLSPRELSASPLPLDHLKGSALAMPGVRIDRLDETLSERNLNRWNLGSMAKNLRLVTPGLSSASSSFSPASTASMVTAGSP